MSEKLFTDLCNHYFNCQENIFTVKEEFADVFSAKAKMNKNESKDSSNNNYNSKFYQSENGKKWADFFIKHSSLNVAKEDFDNLKNDLNKFLIENQKIKEIQNYKELKKKKKK